MIAKPPNKFEYEGVDANLVVIQERYLKNAPRITWTKMGVINHMDTCYADPMHILL